MSVQPEGTRHKFTDRDIRENAELVNLVEQYLNNYQGDFEFLRDAKRALLGSNTLTVGVARGVLNCMRTDPRWAGQVPEPKGYPIPLEQSKPMTAEPRGYTFEGSNRRTKPVEAACIRTAGHYRHAWIQKGATFNCPGVPHLINRKTFDLAATVKHKVVLVRTGNKIHQATGIGHVTWYPPDHEYGFDHLTPRLHVKVYCKYPSWLVDPILMEEIPDVAAISQLREISLCAHCWET